MGRTRDRRVPVCFTQEEYERAKKLSIRFGYKNNVSAYIRRRSLNKKIIVEDIKSKNEILEEIARIGNNINQSTKAINSIALKTRADKNDILEIKSLAQRIVLMQKEVNEIVRDKLFVSFSQSEVVDDND